MGTPADNADLRKAIAPLREGIKNLGDQVKALKASDGAVQRYVGDTEARGEAIANVTLCYRHLEEAQFRLDALLKAVGATPSNEQLVE